MKEGIHLSQKNNFGKEKSFSREYQETTQEKKIYMQKKTLPNF